MVLAGCFPHQLLLAEDTKSDNGAASLSSARQDRERSACCKDGEELQEYPAGPDVEGALFGSSDIYEMVVLATFGEVVQKHITSEGEAKDSRVHPLFLFLLTLPVLVCQTTALVFIKLDYNIGQSVERVSEQHEMDMLLGVLKLMMIVIVQSIMFSKMLGVLRILVFLMVPETWDSVERPWADQMSYRYAFMYRWPIVGPLAILSPLLHVIITYNICIDSASIIFSADHMKSAVYDSLAMIFLADLGQQWWAVVKIVFHFEKSPTAKFKATRQPEVERRRERDPELLRRLKDFVPRKNAGRRMRKIMTMVVTYLICIRQAFIVAMAVDSKVLPVARDLCMWSTFNKGTESWSMVLYKTAYILMERNLLLASPSKAIDEVTHPIDCHDPKYAPMDFEDMGELPLKYKMGTLRLLGVIFLIMAAQAAYMFHERLSRCLQNPEEECDGIRNLIPVARRERVPSGERLPANLKDAAPAAAAAPVVAREEKKVLEGEQVKKGKLWRSDEASEPFIKEEKEMGHLAKREKTRECSSTRSFTAERTSPLGFERTFTGERTYTGERGYTCEGPIDEEDINDLRQQMDELLHTFARAVEEQERAQRKQLEVERRAREELQFNFSKAAQALERKISALEGKRRRIG